MNHYRQDSVNTIICYIYGYVLGTMSDVFLDNIHGAVLSEIPGFTHGAMPGSIMDSVLDSILGIV